MASRGIPIARVPADAVSDELRRILASSGFAGSERMSRFLRFVVERALDGKGEELKEYVLGLEVFGKPASFDPRIDPIVRVEARRLRSKLKSYYEEAGQNDEWFIELPTGSYAPRFRNRTDSAVVAARQAGAARIAVLPFANLSPDPENHYFSDGLTEELIHALTRVDGLRVVAWNTTRQMRSRDDDVYAVGRQLNVETVVTGSVRKSGDRLRIMAQLIDTTSGDYLWSETYERPFADILAIQEEISRAIAATLRMRLRGAAGVKFGRPPLNEEVYTAYLKGRFEWNRRTPEGIRRAIQYFSQAIALDDSFARGHAGLADAWAVLGDQGFAAPAEVCSKAESAALRALELDPTLADAHASLAAIRGLYQWRWQECGQLYEAAIRLNPAYATAHHWYGSDYLALKARFDEALEQMRIAIELDPLSHVMMHSRAYVLLLARRYEESIEACCRTAELEPQFYKAYSDMGRARIHQGRYAEAIELFERARSLAGTTPALAGALGQAHALAGHTGAARELLARLAAMASEQHVPCSAFAMIHIGLGEKERALDWLERGAERRQPNVPTLNVHPAYDPLRGERRFQELVRRIGL